MIRKLGLRAAVRVVRLLAGIGSNKLCYACNERVGRFLPYRGGFVRVPPLIKALDVIGSDIRNFYCPRCGAHDRERHLLMYFDCAGIWRWIEGGRVLHFAPEGKMSEKILNAGPAQYVKADLLPAAPDIIREDITKLSFADGSFDMVMANHVLEHVLDDRAAMREILRVLKPGGVAVLQTPFSDKLADTFENSGISDNESRLHAFGQEDHVRLYGRDLFARLENCGFVPKTLMHNAVLGQYDPVVYGVNGREPFICMGRPADG